MEETITNLILNLGFPIVVVLICMYWIKYITDNHNKQIEDMDIRHTQELKDVTSALNNNTNVMHQILTVLQQNYRDEK